MDKPISWCNGWINVHTFTEIVTQTNNGPTCNLNYLNRLSIEMKTETSPVTAPFIDKTVLRKKHQCTVQLMYLYFTVYGHRTDRCNVVMQFSLFSSTTATRPKHISRNFSYVLLQSVCFNFQLKLCLTSLVVCKRRRHWRVKEIKI
jgi:hypothetical protein